MYQVWYRNFLFFRKTFVVSLFWTILEPIMYLGALGYGFGHYISSIENLSFVEFYFAGLLCTTVMMVSYFESTYPAYTKLTHQKTYLSMLLTPLSAEQIFMGELFWGATKGLIGAFGVFIISSMFGLFTYKFILILPILFLLSLVFSAFGLVMMALAKNYDSFIFSTSGVIVPLSLISGTYFSLNEIPHFLKVLAYCFPLAHAVTAVRGLLYRDNSLTVLIHTVPLLIFLFVLIFIGKRLFNNKLIS